MCRAPTRSRGGRIRNGVGGGAQAALRQAQGKKSVLPRTNGRFRACKSREEGHDPEGVGTGVSCPYTESDGMPGSRLGRDKFRPALQGSHRRAHSPFGKLRVKKGRPASLGPAEAYAMQNTQMALFGGRVYGPALRGWANV